MDVSIVCMFLLNRTSSPDTGVVGRVYTAAE